MKVTTVLLVTLALAAPALAGKRRGPNRPSGSTTTTSTTTTTARTTTTTAATTTTATTTTESLSTYAQEVLAAAQAAISSGSCGASATSCSSSCYSATESVYIEYTDDTYRYVIVNGIPDHTANEGAESPNPNDACEIRSYIKVPINATITGYQGSGMGAVGLTVSGAFIYNPYSNPTGVDDVAVLNEGSSFDSCDGHADFTCSYHYHEAIGCVTDGTDCPKVGYMLDGVPVYGFCTVDGVQLKSCYSQTSGDGYSTGDYEWVDSSDCHLDVNNGYTFEDGTYGYVLTDSYPYTPPGYMATPADYCTF